MGTQLRQAVSSLESAKADNLALVERLRYVQGYRAQTRGRGKSLLSQSCIEDPTDATCMSGVILVSVTSCQKLWHGTEGVLRSVVRCRGGAG